jgi:hypothetical protein
MEFERVLSLVAEAIEASGHRWVVAGGLAMQAYGFARTTQDVDIVTSAEAQDGLVRFMESRGYETLLRSAGFSNHAHADPVWGRVDFIYVDATTAGRVLANCRNLEWRPGRTIPAVSPEHLIAMKVQAMKNDPLREFADMGDIQYLMARPDVSRKAVQRYFEGSGLKDRFDELIRRLS